VSAVRKPLIGEFWNPGSPPQLRRVADKVERMRKCAVADHDALDVEEDEVDEGEVLSCPECGTDFEVATVNPVELKPVDEEEEYEDDEEEEETEDGDYS